MIKRSGRGVERDYIFEKGASIFLDFSTLALDDGMN
jgi:hypothetical protein